MHITECTWALDSYSTHCGLVTPRCVSGRVTIGPGNGLLPVQLQAGQCWFIVNKIPKNQLKWNLNFKMQSFSFSTMNLKMLSAKCQPFCSGLSLLMSTHSLPRKFSGWVNIRYVFPIINYIVLQQQNNHIKKHVLYPYLSHWQFFFECCIETDVYISDK